MIRLEFDWPVSELSPNSRARWGKIAATKAARAMGRFTLIKWREDHEGPDEQFASTIEVQFHFYPPDKRRRDLDNMHGMCKAYQDGVFEALGLNDSLIEIVELRRYEPEKPGHVVMYIMPADEIQY